ncbi:hypothetical protein JCM10213_008981 [Rhodosporidiobolus nylandii]
MHLLEALHPPLPPSSSSRPSTASAPPAALPSSASTFIPPNSSRGPRDFKLPSLTLTRTKKPPRPSDDFLSSRPASGQELRPSSPSPSLYDTAPASTYASPALSRFSTSSTSIASPEHLSPPVPKVPAMFQQSNPSRRPKTADSNATNASRSSFGKAFSRVFGMSSSSSLKSGQAFSASNLSLTSTAAPMSETGVSEATKRMGALEVAREKGRRAVAFVKRRISSKTPVEQQPKTWDDWLRAYGNYEIDIEDPPLPPQRIAPEGAAPTAFQNRFLPGPLPSNERERQNVINRLDLFGTKAAAAAASQTTLDMSSPSSTAMVPAASVASTMSCSSYLSPSEAPSSRRGSSSGFSVASTSTSATSTLPSPSPSKEDAVASLQGHPVFRQLVSRAKEVFQTRVGLITVLDNDMQLFIAATGGMPEGLDSMPRNASFCSHAILNEDRGLVVLNSLDDWRFATNMPTAMLGARFYAGVPIMARAGPDDPSIAIGTLCVLDDKPREAFSEAHRRVLRDFAIQASNVIEAWVADRMTAKMARLHGSFSSSKPALTSPPLTPPPSAGLAPPPSARRPHTSSGPPTSALPATPPASLHHAPSICASPRSRSHSRQTSDGGESTASSIPSSQIMKPRRPSTLSLGVTTDDPISALPREVQKTFDTAVRMLAKALELELVYLAALDLTPVNSPFSSSSSDPKLRLLSSYGLPTPPPSFDPTLHLKALRAPEGGLVYRNARYSSAASSSTNISYAAGLLIPILEVRRTGYVLCGYSRKEGREFVQRDLTYFCKFAEGLEAGCIKASKTSVA